VSISDRPVGLTPGATFPRTIIFQNTGDTIWDMTSFSVVSASATAWGVTSIALPRSVNPGEWVSVTPTFTAPATASATAFPFSWRVSQTGVGALGEATPTELLSVAP
jgi:hypothetical protein